MRRIAIRFWRSGAWMIPLAFVLMEVVVSEDTPPTSAAALGIFTGYTLGVLIDVWEAHMKRRDNQ